MMNRRHAAALALVGWYLMGPPVRQPKNEEPYLDEHAAYRDWKILHTFKTQNECNAAQQRVIEDANNGKLTSFSGGFTFVLDGDPKPWLDQQNEAECIATDHPRLKEK